MKRALSRTRRAAIILIITPPHAWLGRLLSTARTPSAASVSAIDQRIPVLADIAPRRRSSPRATPTSSAAARSTEGRRRLSHIDLNHARRRRPRAAAEAPAAPPSTWVGTRAGTALSLRADGRLAPGWEAADAQRDAVVVDDAAASVPHPSCSPASFAAYGTASPDLAVASGSHSRRCRSEARVVGCERRHLRRVLAAPSRQTATWRRRRGARRSAAATKALNVCDIDAADSRPVGVRVRVDRRSGRGERRRAARRATRRRPGRRGRPARGSRPPALVGRQEARVLEAPGVLGGGEEVLGQLGAEVAEARR